MNSQPNNQPNQRPALPPHESGGALPAITGLSSAFPMQMESVETPRPLAPARQDPQDPSARQPLRHPRRD